MSVNRKKAQFYIQITSNPNRRYIEANFSRIFEPSPRYNPQKRKNIFYHPKQSLFSNIYVFYPIFILIIHESHNG